MRLLQWFLVIGVLPFYGIFAGDVEIPLAQLEQQSQREKKLGRVRSYLANSVVMDPWYPEKETEEQRDAECILIARCLTELPLDLKVLISERVLSSHEYDGEVTAIMRDLKIEGPAHLKFLLDDVIFLHVGHRDRDPEKIQSLLVTIPRPSPVMCCIVKRILDQQSRPESRFNVVEHRPTQLRREFGMSEEEETLRGRDDGWRLAGIVSCCAGAIIIMAHVLK